MDRPDTSLCSAERRAITRKDRDDCGSSLLVIERVRRKPGNPIFWEARLRTAAGLEGEASLVGSVPRSNPIAKVNISKHTEVYDLATPREASLVNPIDNRSMGADLF